MRKLILAVCFATIAASPALCSTARERMITECDDDKNPDRAIVACKALIASDTETHDGLIVTHIALGYAYFLKEMWGQAIREFDVALDLDVDGSHSYRILLLRGVAHSANCQLDAAIADANRAISLKPGEATPYFNRGLVWLRKGDRKRARADFAQAHQMKPDAFPEPEQAFARHRPPECPKAGANLG